MYRVSLGFFFIHCSVDSIADKTVQAFSLTGGIVFDDLPLTFLNNYINPVIGFFVISSSCVLLCIGICHPYVPLLKNEIHVQYILMEVLQISYNSISIFLLILRIDILAEV